MPAQKDLLCGGRTHYYDSDQTEAKKVQKAYDTIIGGLSDRRAENITNILSKLFPKLSYVLSNSSIIFGYSRQYDHQEALRNCSISCANCFDRYFSLALEPNAIPREAMDFLLFHATEDELTESILKINSQQKIVCLLDYIVAVFKQKQLRLEHTERAKLILEHLLRCWYKLHDSDESSFWTTPLDWRLSWNVEALLNVIDKSARFSTIQLLFEDKSIDISTILTVLRDFETQHHRFTESKSSQQEGFISLDELLELEKIFINRIVSEFESGNLLNNDAAIHAIWLLEQIDEPTAKYYTDRMIDSDSSLAKFISASVRHGKGMGRTVYKIWTVRKDDIKKYIDIDEAYTRILAYAHTGEFLALPADKKENIAAFLIEMEKPNESNSINESILSSNIEIKLKEI
ncbi:MAG: hypothetical protein LLF87_05125 [Eubacteriales bacterium]|nr:hypothetical protein [Eubacteriales bacterium]